ncbi:hypothetical protein GCM10010353_69450 [Streptomyces chryseus]|nr:hypothetical protein GCM10010353_69450 [Streptomyces chryseus]
MKVSKSQATAVNYGTGATAAGLIGAITAGLRGAIAAGVCAYLATLGAEGIKKCKHVVEMKFHYTGKVRGVKCYSARIHRFAVLADRGSGRTYAL